MMRMLTGLSAILACAMLAACDLNTAPRANNLAWSGDLVGAEGWEHLEGWGAFIWREGANSFVAGTMVENDEAGAVRPWHLHHNSCAEGGGIVGNDGHYPRLEINSLGFASADATVPLAIDPDGTYHVNIHLSEEEMNVIIACADMEFEGAFF